MSEKYLSVFGVGPFYVATIISTTVAAILLHLFTPIASIVIFSNRAAIVLGVFLIIEGIVLWVSAVVFSHITAKIKSNKLVTNGVFAYVRNPIYSAFMLLCTGILICFNNLILMVFPLFFYLFLTVLMIRTEEKWLKDLYKQEYVDYCKRVNRCIPMFKINKM